MHLHKVNGAETAYLMSPHNTPPPSPLGHRSKIASDPCQCRHMTMFFSKGGNAQAPHSQLLQTPHSERLQLMFKPTTEYQWQPQLESGQPWIQSWMPPPGQHDCPPSSQAKDLWLRRALRMISPPGMASIG